jgi:hypothetical protein
MIYKNTDGTNVTLSPRRGVGDREPASDSAAETTLLEGSGIANGLMIANVKCMLCMILFTSITNQFQARIATAGREGL